MKARGYALLPVLLLIACSEPTDLSSSECEKPCYTGPSQHRGVGICQPGEPICKDGFLIGCEGEVFAGTETCNGLDDDCDGQVDEAVIDRDIGIVCNYDIYPFQTGVLSKCRWGRYQCVNGGIDCVGVVLPSEETCNGIDDDCNGAIDDNVPPTGVCYEGDLTEVTAGGQCRAGVVSCVNGRQECVGQVRGTVEVCDRIDNDCNGLIDDVDSPDPVPTDVLIVVDRSGSMQNSIDAVKTALLDFMPQHANDPLYRFAVIDVPGPSNGPNPFDAYLALDFADAVTATVTISLLQADHAATEPSYDAFIWSVDGTLSLSWRPQAAKVLLWFGDEHGQSNLSFTERDAAIALNMADVAFYGFVPPNVASYYNDIAAATRGAIYNLMVSYEDIYKIFVQLIAKRCP